MPRRNAHSWKCPKCRRAFAKKHQWHSCKVYTVAKHFRGKPRELKQTFDMLVARLRDLGPLRVDAVQTMIHFFGSRFCFGGVTVKKDHVRLGFVCDDAIQDERLLRTQRVGPRRVGHSINLTSPEDVDDRLMNWLKRAYELQS